MTTDLKTESALTPAQLVAALDSLGVPFLRGASGVSTTVEPAGHLAVLAASVEIGQLIYPLYGLTEEIA